MLVENLKRIPKNYQDPVLWAWLEIFPLPRDGDSETTHSVNELLIHGMNEIS